MNVFISGGCKNGKSHYAQRVAKKMADGLGKPLYYIATMIPRDSEDEARIARHVEERRGWGFTTIEQGVRLTELLDDISVDKSGVFLLDSVTALLANEMFDAKGNMDRGAGKRVISDLLELASRTGNTVFVSDYVYGDSQAYGETTELYRKSLAAADRALAACCHRVVEISYGIEEIWK